MSERAFKNVIRSTALAVAVRVVRVDERIERSHALNRWLDATKAAPTV